MLTRITALLLFASIPTLASAAPLDEHLGQVFYASACEQTASSDRPTSAFCQGSASHRTLPAHALHAGSSFQLRAGGHYSVSTNNAGAFSVGVKVDQALLAITTPVLLQVERQRFEVRVDCVAFGAAELRCNGMLTLLLPAPGTMQLLPIYGALKIKPGAVNEVDLVASSGRASAVTIEDAILDVEVAR